MAGATKHMPAGLEAPLDTYAGLCAVLKPSLALLETVKKAFPLDEACSEHVVVVQDISKAYKALIPYTASADDVCKLHKRRIDVLEPVALALNPQCYDWLCKELWYEIGDAYRDMLDIKVTQVDNGGKAVSKAKLEQTDALSGLKREIMLMTLMEHGSILRGLASSRLEPNGWTNVVRTGLSTTDLSTVGWGMGSQLRLTIPAFEGYDPLTTETLAWALPGDVLMSGQDADVVTPLEVEAMPGTAALSGFVDYDATARAVRWGQSSRWSEEENALLTEDMELRLALSRDEWAPTVGQDNAISEAMLRALSSTGSEAGGWNAVVQPTLTARSLRRVDARRLEISVRAAGYDITAPETLTIVVPKAALLSQQANVTVLPHLVVYPTPGALRLGGEEGDRIGARRHRHTALGHGERPLQVRHVAAVEQLRAEELREAARVRDERRRQQAVARQQLEVRAQLADRRLPARALRAEGRHQPLREHHL